MRGAAYSSKLTVENGELDADLHALNGRSHPDAKRRTGRWPGGIRAAIAEVRATYGDSDLGVGCRKSLPSPHPTRSRR